MQQRPQEQYLSGTEGQPLALAADRVLPTPEPSAGIEAYRRERELALAHDPRRRANYQRFQETQRTGAVLDYLPVKLDIENVSRCNFRCTMCQVSDWPKGRRAADLSLDAFKALIDEQYGLVEIKLQGMGEPLLQRDEFFEMVRYARRSHIWVRTTTNASLLHMHDNHRKLIDADPNEVQISIDGATKEVFETIRRGSVFERVVENCALVNRYCEEQGVERTKMWVVVQRDNAHQLAELVDLAARIGFRSMAFSLNLSDWGQVDWNRRNGEATVEHVFDMEACHGLIERGAALGVTVAFWSVTTKYSSQSKATLCPWPFERAYVASDLRVVPCCTIANPEVFDVGDASDLADTWNGKAYREFREGHLSGRIPKICQGCYRPEDAVP